MTKLDGLVDNRVMRKFTWGLDLSGSLEGAGGIGGLQAIEDLDDPNDANDLHGQFVACYDGLGNLTQLIDWESAMTAGSFDASTHIAAHYEYSPYGQVVRQTGSYAAENPFRFSTKWFDGETGLGNWGRRYLILEQGRWLNRDPIGENGGLNLFAYVINSPLVNIDPFGESSLDTLSPMMSVCCQYTHNYYVDGSFGSNVYQADVICGIANPNECCRCIRIHDGHNDEYNSIKLVKASYGKCCTCTIYKVRVAGDAWPSLQSLIIECPNKAWKIDFQMKGGADTDNQISCPGTIRSSFITVLP
jgi:RHS repeat-associated protein